MTEVIIILDKQHTLKMRSAVSKQKDMKIVKEEKVNPGGVKFTIEYSGNPVDMFFLGWAFGL